jgi:hypothetical protein
MFWLGRSLGDHIPGTLPTSFYVLFISIIASLLAGS